MAARDGLKPPTWRLYRAPALSLSYLAKLIRRDTGSRNCVGTVKQLTLRKLVAEGGVAPAILLVMSELCSVHHSAIKNRDSVPALFPLSSVGVEAFYGGDAASSLIHYHKIFCVYPIIPRTDNSTPLTLSGSTDSCFIAES